MSSLLSLSPDTNSARKRLLVVQPLVGIGDMVWHKPWIDHLAGGFDVILAAKPTAHAKTLFHGTDGIVAWLDIDRSMRGCRGRHDGLAGLFRLAKDFRRARAEAILVMHHSKTYAMAARIAGIPMRWGYGIGNGRRWLNQGIFLDDDARNERPYKKLGRYALANGFGLDNPRWKMSTLPERGTMCGNIATSRVLPLTWKTNQMAETWWSLASGPWIMNGNGHPHALQHSPHIWTPDGPKRK